MLWHAGTIIGKGGGYRHCPAGVPIPWAAVSGFGGDFGPKLKLAGYDAIVIVGKARSPKYLYVSEDGAELVDGEFLWGMASFTTQDALVSKHSDDIAIACIGPAGQNRVRWATIQAKTENAAGQGGFGAVMGDKKLKAIAIKPGSCKIKIANPDKLIEEAARIPHELIPKGLRKLPLSVDYDRYTTRKVSCAWAGCTGAVTECLHAYPYYNKIPMKYTGDGSI